MNDPYICARQLSKSFDRHGVLSGICAEVRAGDVIGLLGANGAGKTTLIEVLLGLSPPNAGSALLFGADAIRAPASSKARIGYVPQSDELVGMLSGRQYLDLISSFYPAWDATLTASLVEQWHVDLGKSIAACSTGERQKIAIICALAHRPDLLVLDEPVASLDAVARRQFLQQILQVAADERRAVLFSSHIVSDVERLATIIWILKDRELLWQGDLDTLKESVIRVHVPADAREGIRASFHRVVAERAVNGSGWILTAVRSPQEDWTDLPQKLGSGVRVESLGLEDIFLELHS